jgi:CO/xanthine dehydrogenase FAD-binding subunit
MDINKFNTHIIPIQFEYHAPTSIDEALRLLGKYGGEAHILAGGTDLVPKMKQRLLEPRHIINLKKIPELAGIKETPEGIRIGALTKLRTIDLSPLIKEKLSLLNEAVRGIGSVQIRNMGTIGGNLCNASPTADTATALLALDAEAQIADMEGTRTVPMEKFFAGRGKTVLTPYEILTGVSSPHLPKGTGASFLKIGWTSFDIATVNLAIVLKLVGEKIRECRIALGACSPAPIRVHKAEKFLIGRTLTRKVLDEAANIVSEYVEPRERWRRAPPEYREKTSKGLTMEALTKAAKQARRLTQ